MAKTSEQNYPILIGENGRMHVRDKPFSDPDCGTLLSDIGLIISLLPEPPARLLDIGCGSGWTSCFFASHSLEVVGADISVDMINLAQQNQRKFNLPNLSFIQSDYENLAFENEFDCAVFYDSLHHSDSEVEAIKSAYNALKPGGILITHEPGEGHSKTAAAITAMEKYGVNERDMPPCLIIQAGKLAGFSRFQVFPMPARIISAIYKKHSSSKPLNYLLIMLHLLRLIFFRTHKRGSVVVLTK
jgi:ubiquinone/menaquinone biosynthesis C-methylase UbiE